MYKITIEKIETANYTGREYKQIADTGNEEDGGAKYGYVEYKTTKQDITNILSQSVEELDLPAVIKAINKL